ncbi:GNAT family N-acetyltransferase [Pontibacter vulgaris]|uniref:GNAT family N-acetyltransferase n=1 Tax=Pontibacter vulgaris TaxID=2905679 RepID=UPI001FA75133|nr:GNAT family protein [Pontibacter vulgaris]
MSYLFNILPESFEERLETENLLLRPYQEGDESDFMRLIQENSVKLNPAFSGRLARVRALEDARIQVQQLRTDWDNRKVFDFGVWLKGQDTYIGDIALKNIDHKIPKAEIGLYFTGWPETKSHVQEALYAVLDFAFKTMQLKKVYLRLTQANAFYEEVVLTCGFIKEGVLRNEYRGVDSDELLDLGYYGITLTDYEQHRQVKQTGSEAMV